MGTVLSRNLWPESRQEMLIMSSERQYDCPSALEDTAWEALKESIPCPQHHQEPSQIKSGGGAHKDELNQLRSSRSLWWAVTGCPGLLCPPVWLGHLMLTHIPSFQALGDYSLSSPLLACFCSWPTGCEQT